MLRPATSPFLGIHNRLNGLQCGIRTIHTATVTVAVALSGKETAVHTDQWETVGPALSLLARCSRVP